MATVYSLICWGGRTGKKVTMTIASPCVVTLMDHGLRNGTGLVFSTDGVLPTGITAGTTYYARSINAGTFNLYYTAANAIAGGTTGRINTSGSQSGTHTAKSKLMLDYLTQYAGRWGALGSERCYGGANSWIAGRSGASDLNEEVGEIGEAFTDHLTEDVKLGLIPAAKATLTTMVAGSRSPAWHGGNWTTTESLTAGYWAKGTSIKGYMIHLDKPRATVDGIVAVVNTWDLYRIINMTASITRCTNSILRSEMGKPVGVFCQSAFGLVENNVIGPNCSIGIQPYDWIDCMVVGNIVFACDKGFYSYTPACYLYNNISIGNTGPNWEVPSTMDYIKAATNNAGLSGEAWVVGSGTRITIATTDFVNYAGRNFRPALATSPQVDAGVEYYDIARIDIAGDERPNYNNGGTEAFDAGCYEFDHGYGLHPAVINLTLAGVVAGSEIRVFLTSDGTEVAGIESCLVNQELTFQANVSVRILIINTAYKLIDFIYAAGVGDISIPITMESDPWFNDPV